MPIPMVNIETDIFTEIKQFIFLVFVGSRPMDRDVNWFLKQKQSTFQQINITQFILPKFVFNFVYQISDN